MSEKTTDEMEMEIALAHTAVGRLKALSEAFADFADAVVKSMPIFEKIVEKLNHEIRADDARSQKRVR